jgi:hypothetical protein
LPKPFEVPQDELEAHLDAYVDSVFGDLTSSFLVMPKGPLFVEYGRFSEAYETLKAATAAFRDLSEARVWAAVEEDSLCLLVLRTMMGVTPPELAELARQDGFGDIDTGFARGLDGNVRAQRDYIRQLRRPETINRVQGLIAVACKHLRQDVPPGADDTVHRLNKFDTSDGLVSIQNAADRGAPYSVLLYERYLGRPFASHRDSVSELIGDVMESAIESRLSGAHITFRKTKRAERIPGFEQAPDFIVPDEVAARVVIEAKMAGDDGTARDKVARIIRLTTLSDERIQAGRAGFQVVACIDGRGFGVRREDMRQLLVRTRGKVFTLANLDDLIANTDLAGFLPHPA